MRWNRPEAILNERKMLNEALDTATRAAKAGGKADVDRVQQIVARKWIGSKVYDGNAITFLVQTSQAEGRHSNVLHPIVNQVLDKLPLDPDKKPLMRFIDPLPPSTKTQAREIVDKLVTAVNMAADTEKADSFRQRGSKTHEAFLKHAVELQLAQLRYDPVTKAVLATTVTPQESPHAALINGAFGEIAARVGRHPREGASMVDYLGTPKVSVALAHDVASNFRLLVASGVNVAAASQSKPSPKVLEAAARAAIKTVSAPAALNLSPRKLREVLDTPVKPEESKHAPLINRVFKAEAAMMDEARRLQVAAGDLQRGIRKQAAEGVSTTMLPAEIHANASSGLSPRAKRLGL